MIRMHNIYPWDIGGPGGKYSKKGHFPPHDRVRGWGGGWASPQNFRLQGAKQGPSETNLHTSANIIERKIT